MEQEMEWMNELWAEICAECDPDSLPDAPPPEWKIKDMYRLAVGAEM